MMQVKTVERSASGPTPSWRIQAVSSPPIFSFTNGHRRTANHWLSPSV
ncbi:high-affinity nicotinic acid transporter [Cryptococcus neoformans]|nr:high-affinity nicotinic acid transporter [Cryptococcus neoformans var. grubii]